MLRQSSLHINAHSAHHLSEAQSVGVGYVHVKEATQDVISLDRLCLMAIDHIDGKLKRIMSFSIGHPDSWCLGPTYPQYTT